MTDSFSNFSTTQHITKDVIWTEGGIVASQHRKAAEVGARVLAAGGDAIDAAVATSFAVGVVEPWMSGPMGGGMMTLWRADEDRAETIEFGMRSPMSLDPADYPLEPGKAADLFPWTRVQGRPEHLRRHRHRRAGHRRRDGAGAPALRHPALGRPAGPRHRTGRCRAC